MNQREIQREIQRKIQRERERGRERQRDRERERRQRESKTDFSARKLSSFSISQIVKKKTKKSCALNRRGTHSLTYSCKAMLVASRRHSLASNSLLCNSTEELRAWLCNHGHAPFKELWQPQARLLRLSLDQDTYAL